tara:strand:- start:485 stop:898 length:414 start_codon:yes stop_codon:yes gene_type:complete
LKKKFAIVGKIVYFILMTIKKTFSDLEFNAHANHPNGVQAKLDLGNNTEISVVSMLTRESEFGGLYGDVSKGTYEVAVFQGDNMIPLSAWDDVIGWRTEDEITELMSKLQNGQDDTQAFIDELYLAKSKNRAELGLD